MLNINVNADGLVQAVIKAKALELAIQASAGMNTKNPVINIFNLATIFRHHLDGSMEYPRNDMITEWEIKTKKQDVSESQ